jgi:hypothetical protein
VVGCHAPSASGQCSRGANAGHSGRDDGVTQERTASEGDPYTRKKKPQKPASEGGRYTRKRRLKKADLKIGHYNKEN